MPRFCQRILRALEVVEHTGTPLSVWQAVPRVPALPPMQWHGVVVVPERSVLRACIAQRAEAMWHGGALPEVQALMDAGVPDDAPVCRAIGVAEIRAYLRGECTQAQALERLTTTTQQYAKRQVTWARHQL
jgi:tRNA dimethylallyltransferase